MTASPTHRVTANRRRRFLEQNAPAMLVLATYLLLLFSRLLDTALLDRENEYLGIVLLQIMIFLFPGLVFCKLKGNSFTRRLRLRLPRPQHILFLTAGLFTLIFGCLLIAIQTGGIHSLETGFSLYDTFSTRRSGGAGNTLYLILAYALLPAICEELIFRGILPASLESRGVIPALLASSVFFAMLHFQLSELPIYLFAGALLFCVTYATRSIFSAVLLHAGYNLFGLFGQDALTDFYLYTGSTELFSFLLVCLFLLFLILFLGEAGRIYRYWAKSGADAAYRSRYPLEDLPRRVMITMFSPFGIACIICFVIVCLF